MATVENVDLDPAVCEAAFQACACFHFRKASRAVTQMFDDALQSSGLRSTQLVILLAIKARHEPTIATLARELVMDPSTLNRNLQPLTREKLVRSKSSPDGRRKILSLTAKGEKAVATAVPLWQSAQSSLTEHIGAERWETLRDCLQDVAATSRHT